MAFIRRVRTKSGATAVQIAEYVKGRQRIVKHHGSAHTEAELGVLMARAQELLEDTAQGTLELDVQPAPPAASLVRPAPEPCDDLSLEGKLEGIAQINPINRGAVPAKISTLFHVPVILTSMDNSWRIAQ